DGGGSRVTVPNVLFKTVDEAERIVTDAGLKAQRSLEDNEAEPNTVFATEPPPDREVDKGSTVVLKVSRGQAAVPVPAVVGQDVDTARRILERAGFAVDVTTRPDDDTPANRVIDQAPDGATEAPKGSTVTLTVSEGRSRVAVPNVVGEDVSGARDAIANAGLRVRTVNQPSDRPEGTVLSSNPPPGTEVPQGSTVTLVVAARPPETTTTTAFTPTTTFPSNPGDSFDPDGDEDGGGRGRGGGQ
ncbi:MAG TPA: PASTA domain-containing protein, partial [Acidimicrobiales bacterium]|nr:PASTA domain-containing protein [Acidimicrobiales bacterium]